MPKAVPDKGTAKASIIPLLTDTSDDVPTIECKSINAHSEKQTSDALPNMRPIHLCLLGTDAAT
jgi:hypothetical protein